MEGAALPKAHVLSGCQDLRPWKKFYEGVIEADDEKTLYRKEIYGQVSGDGSTDPWCEMKKGGGAWTCANADVRHETKKKKDHHDTLGRM